MGRQRNGATGVEGLHPADVNWLPNFEHPCHHLLAVIAEVKAQLQCSRLATYIIAPNSAVGEIAAWRRCPHLISVTFQIPQRHSTYYQGDFFLCSVSSGLFFR